MEDQKCYVFKPSEERPTKKRRLVQKSRPSGHDTFQERRKEICDELWTSQQTRIDEVLDGANRATLDSIVSFISSSGTSEHVHPAKIPTGLVVAGASIASHGKFFERLSREVVGETSSCFVTLNSSECPNLKTLLKNLISKATSQALEDEDGEEQLPTKRRGPKLLNYDLQILYEWYQEQDVRHVVITFQDSEAFEGQLLADVISLFSAWLDRIPFILLFGIATSAGSFQEKLPHAAVRNLEGQKFDVVQADIVLEQVFQSTIEGDIPLRIGPTLSARLLERQKDHIQSIETFVDALKYAYMTHFYANPLSIFLQEDLTYASVSSSTLAALRNLDSFRKTAEDLVEDGETTLARSLLIDDSALFAFTTDQLSTTRTKLSNLATATLLLKHLRACIPRLPPTPLSTLYVRALAGDLLASPLLRDLMLSIKKAPSDVLSTLLSTLATHAPSRAVAQLQTDLTALVTDTADATATATTPLRSAHAIAPSSLRTTVVAQKVTLAKHRSALSARDAAYSALVDKVHGLLAEYWESFLSGDPKEWFGWEVCVYDLKSPHVDVFMPRTRFAVERALERPGDYLGCACCSGRPEGREDGGGEATLSSTQPPTAILYQLYLESGTLINVSDLWSAFHAIISDDDNNDDNNNNDNESSDGEAKAMALFQRSLAELRYLGLVKASRKKTDHVAKMAWKGL